MSTGTIYNFHIVFTKRGELLGGRSNSSTVQIERFFYGGGKSSTVEDTSLRRGILVYGEGDSSTKRDTFQRKRILV
jgi:hypothetical protein